MRRLRLSSALTIAVLTLSACASSEREPSTEATSTPPSNSGSTSGSTPSGTPSTPTPSDPTPSPDGPATPTVEVRIAGERVTPNAEQLDLTAGETMVFEISSDRAGELHVHSKPEQYVKIAAGRTRADITIDTPGSVKVEEHDTNAVVAIVDVR